MVLTGGERGGKSFFVLLINTFIGIVSVILLGSNVNGVLILFVSCILFSVVTIFYQNGFQLKTLTSFAATTIISLFISLSIYVFCIGGHISGFNEIEQYEEGYNYIGSAVTIKILIVFAISIIWGALGAVIDTSISISSVQNEILLHNPDIATRDLFKSGMLVGKDILGTTINTLTFVALGESLMLCLYYINFHYSFAELMNSKSFFQELAIILFSCIGCVLIIPVTALLYACSARCKKIVSLFSNK